MPLSELQMSIGKKIASGLDERTLALIYDKLMDIEEEKGGSIPVNCKIIFGVDADGILSYDIVMSSSIPVFKSTVRLSSDGKQLRLWMDNVKKTETPATKAAPAKKAAAKKPAPKPAAAPKKKAKAPASKTKGMNGATPKKKTAPPAPPPPRKKPTVSAEERQREIIASNTQMYQDKLITREQAIEGGVDVDQVDGVEPEGVGQMDEMDLAESYGGEISDLDLDEIAALDELVDE